MFKSTASNTPHNKMNNQSTKDERKGRFSRFLEKRKEEKSVPGPRPTASNNFNSDSAYASSENDQRKDTPDPDFVRVQDHHLPGVSQDKSLWLDKHNGEVYDEGTGDVVTTVTTTTTTTTTTTGRGGRKQEVVDVQTTQGEPRSHSLGRSGTTTGSGTLGLSARDAGGLNEMPAGATHVSHTTSGIPSTAGAGTTSYTAPNTTGGTINPLNTSGNKLGHNTGYNTNERSTFGNTSGHHGLGHNTTGLGHNNTGLNTNERSNFGNNSSNIPGHTGTGSVLHNNTTPTKTGTTFAQGLTGNTTTLPDRTGHNTYGDNSGRNALGSNTTGLNTHDRTSYGDTTGSNTHGYNTTGGIPNRHDSSPPIPSRNPGRRSGEWSQNDVSDYDRDHPSAVSPIASNQHNFSYPSRATPTGGVADNASARSSGSTLANLKAAAIAAHGIGETLRGTLNNAVDSRYSRGNADKAAAVNAKNQATLERGRGELERFNTGSTFRSGKGNNTGAGHDGLTRENTTSSVYNPIHGNTTGTGYNDRTHDSIVGTGNNNLNRNETIGNNNLDRNDTLGYNDRNNDSTIGTGSHLNRNDTLGNNDRNNTSTIGTGNNLNRNETLGYNDRNNTSTVETGNNVNRNDTFGSNYNDTSNTSTLTGRNNNNNNNNTVGTGYNDTTNTHTSHLGNNQSSTLGVGHNDPLRSHAPTSTNPLTSGTTNTNTNTNNTDYHPPTGTMVGNNSTTTNTDTPDYVAGRDYSSGNKSSGGIGKLFKRKPLNETETRSQGQNQSNRYF